MDVKDVKKLTKDGALKIDLGKIGSQKDIDRITWIYTNSQGIHRPHKGKTSKGQYMTIEAHPPKSK